MARSETAPAWRRAFLRELARGGSVALAAAAAGIDRSTAYQLRRSNAAFAASWERALSFARLRLNGSFETVLPPAGSAFGSASHPSPPQDERIGRARPRPPRLRPDECVRASKAGRPCVVRAGPGRWSVAAEAAFLAALTASANVTAAARAAGVSAVAAYNRRKQWPGFAAAWDAAKAEGYERLEMALLHAATATLDPEPAAAAGDPPAMSVAEALNLLRLHRASVQGGAGQRYGWRAQEPGIDAVRAEILRRVAAIEAARGKEPNSAAGGRDQASSTRKVTK